MKAGRLRLYVLLVFLGILLAACSSSPSNERFEPYPEENQILGLTNAFRAQAQTCGAQQFPAAPALTWVEAVGDTAWFHSIDMGARDTENHVGANTVDRLKARGFDPGLTAEHRKKTALPASPADAFNVWKADPVACADLMNPGFTVMGAGLWGKYEGGTAAYWTQILTTPKENAQPTLTFTPPTATVTVGGAAIAFTANLTDSAEAITFSLTGPGSFTSVGATATYTPPTTGGAGTATLTAKAGALTASATITITAATPPPGLTVTPTTALVAVGAGPIQFKSSTNQVSWEMTGVGTFSWAGDTFTYNPPATGTGGTATITVRSGELTATATVTVVTLSVAPATATVAVGGAAIPFSATLTSSTDPIAWSLTGPGSLSSTAGTTTSYTPPTTGGADTATLTATVGTVTASATVTINAANPDALQVNVKDLQRQALVPPFSIHSLGRHLSDLPVAPLAADPNGGAYILWIRQTDNKAFLTRVDGAGNTVGDDQDLGAGLIAGAVGTDGTKVAYLLKTGADQMVFRVVGGGETVLVNNSQPGPWANAATTFGNNAMLKPIDYRRQAVVPVGGNWFTSFDHNNNFGTPQAPEVHTGMSMVMLNGNGTAPTLAVNWGASHSLDILALYDGQNIINVMVGDAFPQDFRLHVLSPQGQPLPIGAGNRVDLFAKNAFMSGGDTLNSVPGNQTGLSSGKLGGLHDIGGGQFALTYLLQPSDGLAAKVNEIGMLTFDKQGTAKRFVLKDGAGVKYVRSARYGANILVAWETTAGKFFAMVVNAQGNVVKAEQELIGGAAFSERDSFINLSNGDVMWTASVGGSLKLFRLAAP